ncbi:hypothetical protein LOZ58_000473 [Ophidiomyces ophidiicola]|nr:hypothetical protein LOZ65_000207 [Ophidiomyces ophidiicola]KAI1966981.1 hypothetical protein LOZ58_000473 [Ophidiomyces ophidiicola]
MAAVSTTSAFAGGPIDPSKQAEYPILLGDKLAGKPSSRQSRFVNVAYNYKAKSASPQQKTTITKGNTPDLYQLTIQDKASNAERTNLTYLYHGSVDPASSVSEPESSNLVLVFDPKRKAFILEPVSTKLNFNLRSAPGKTDKQVAEQYEQLNTLSNHERDDSSREDDDDAADEGNPYDFRHFLPKSEPSSAKNTDYTPPKNGHGSHNPSNKAPTHLTPAAALNALPPKTKPPPKPKPQVNPLRPQPKRVTKAAMAKNASAPKPKPKPAPIAEPEPPVVESPPSEPEPEPKPTPPETSSSNNIIVDGDLIIDMGSPPPERPKFKLNPRNFASNNTSANEAGSDEEEDVRSPSPPRLAGSRVWQNHASQQYDGHDEEEEEESDEDAGEVEQETNDYMADDDDLAAEMEAAFEESAREEEEERARNLLLQQQQQQRLHVVSDEESEISEEE